MTTAPTDQQLADARARQAEAAREDLARTAHADQALLADDAGPDWRAVEHAEHKLAFVDVTAMCAVQDLDKQNDARGREVQRLAAEVAQWKRRALRAEGAMFHALWMSPLAYNNETAAEMTTRFRLHIEATYPDLVARYVHQPVEAYQYADGCGCTDYESAKYENDHSEEAEDGYVCSRSLLGRICEHCEDEDGDGPDWARDSVLWPCPPIAELNALTDAGVLAAAMSRPES